MGWQATGDPWTGGTPGRDPGLPGPPSCPPASSHGGPWETAAPSAALAVALEHAAGPEDLYPARGTDALVGIARQWAAVESWAAAGKLAALRAMTREDGAAARCCAAAATCPTAGTTPSPTRCPGPWRWGRCPRGTSRPWPGPWAPGWRAPAGCSPPGS